METSSSIYEQLSLWDSPAYPQRAAGFPLLRYMGSKHRLLPWIHDILSKLSFASALDAFAGTNCVAYLMKAMGKRVVTNDFLNFSYQIALATIENSAHRLSESDCARLLEDNPSRSDFIERTFTDIFFTPADLRFLDNIWTNIPKLPTCYHRALAIAALVRACVKRQPRGVFTVAGDPEHYKDGRRDLRLSLREHFLESVAAYNAMVFDSGQPCQSLTSDVFDVDPFDIDLVYMDPPYVPRSDDNCYIKRYHFLEGLASYWQGEGTEIVATTKVKKVRKRYTPFSYRHSAVEAFDRMFAHFRNSILVLSYSSNGYPDLDQLLALMRKYKGNVQVFKRPHRYHFGTHGNVSEERVRVHEYMVVGS